MAVARPAARWCWLSPRLLLPWWRSTGARLAGFSRGFLVTAAIGLLVPIIALAAIRVTREDLSGVDPPVAPAG